MKSIFLILFAIFCSHTIMVMGQEQQASLRLINQTIQFMSNKAILGPNSLNSQLLALKKQHNVVAGYAVKTINNEIIYTLTSVTDKNGNGIIGFPLNITILPITLS